MLNERGGLFVITAEIFEFYQCRCVKANNFSRIFYFLYLSLSPFFCRFVDFSFFFSSEIGSRAFTTFNKIAELVNGREDIKLVHVNCDADAEFCDTNNAKGKLIRQKYWLDLWLFFKRNASGNVFILKLLTELAVYFYPEGQDRILLEGVKSEEGLSQFLIKNLGDTILVISMMPKLLRRFSALKFSFS